MRSGVILGMVGVIAIVLVVTGCVSAAPPAPAVLEDVSYQELADKSRMEENDNRLVRVTVQYLGPDVAMMPSQALFTDVADVILVNHSKVGYDYSTKEVTSGDTFLVGFPGTDEYSRLVEGELELGDTITVTGVTQYVSAGFGSFQHLLLRVQEVEQGR